MADRRRVVRTSFRLFAFIGVFGLVASCGRSVRRTEADNDEAGAGGSAPTGGRSTSPSGGRGGGPEGGATVGGGRGGSVTTGGRGGSGGAGGFGGRSETGGSAGQGGCSEPEVDDSLAHCPAHPYEGGQPRSSCTLEATCVAMDCGDPWSDFDASGCRRLHCSSQADCSSTQRCVPAVLGGRYDCYSSVYEGCDADCGNCYCTGSDDCATAAFCQPAAAFPPENDCRLDELECGDLSLPRLMLEIYLESLGYSNDIRLALEACADAVARRIDECNGAGGAGGE